MKHRLHGVVTRRRGAADSEGQRLSVTMSFCAADGKLDGVVEGSQGAQMQPYGRLVQDVDEIDAVTS